MLVTVVSLLLTTTTTTLCGKQKCPHLQTAFNTLNCFAF